jgi:hypothetical protein
VDTPTLVGTGFVVLGAVVWVVCAIYAWRIAPTFGRSRGAWTVAAIILGPIALMILYVLPKKPALAGHGKTHKDPQAELYEQPHKR